MTTTRDQEVAHGIQVLRDILKRKRWDDQGGYAGYRGNGKWDFVSTGLAHVTPKELNALFALVGVVPDAIVAKGACKDCRNSKDGYEQGYSTHACITCKRPKMSNFAPFRKNTHPSRRGST
jgi:hypothetical protein